MQDQEHPNACSAWLMFQEDLAVYEFDRITMWGTLEPDGVSCSGPKADEICQALWANESITVACDGHTWTTGPCGNEYALSVSEDGEPYYCLCPESDARVLRPCNQSNWGGYLTETCGGPSQTIGLACEVL